MPNFDERIPELPELFVISGETYLAIYDPATDTTKKIKQSVLNPTASAVDYTWSASVVYNLDDISVWNNQIYVSLQNTNANKMPGATGSETFWQLGTKITGSVIRSYSPGIYTDTEVFVSNVVGGFLFIYKLKVATPFNSTNFATELAANKWEAVGKAYVDSVSVQHFRGYYTTLSALTTAVPTGVAGDYAIVDVGSGTSASQYIWDTQDGWVLGSGGVVPNASTTIAGSVEEGTDTEVQDSANTGVGGTGARLFVSIPRLWVWWTYVKTQVQTFAAKITFTSAPRFSSVTASQYLKVDASKDLASVAAIPATDVTEDTTHRFATDTEKTTWNGKQNALGFTPENSANKGASNGYAPLDSSTKIPSAYLPAYVDDVLEYANFAALPATGTSGIIYVTIDTNYEYRWSGSAYIRLVSSPGTTDALAEGTTNLYFTAARVLATVLAGLSTATNAAITASDTVLSALGKLQKQITDLPTTFYTWIWNYATTVTATTDTIDTARAGKKIRYNSATDVTVTIPLNATDAIPIGSRYALRQSNTGKVIISPISGVTVNTPDASLLSTQKQYSELYLVKAATDTWELLIETSSFWTWIKTQAQTIAAAWTFNDVLLTNQAAASGEQRPVFIDNTGKLQKSQFTKFDETNKLADIAGKDNLHSLLLRLKNSDGTSLVEFYNDFVTQFGGTIMAIEVPSTITAGNAYINFRDITGEQFALKDQSSNRYLTFEKLSDGSRVVRLKRDLILDSGIGLEVRRSQVTIRTTTTNSAQNTVITFAAIATGYTLVLTIRAFIKATDGSVVRVEPYHITATNNAGTLTKSENSPTHQRLVNTGTTGTINSNISSTDLQIRYQNEATGKTWDVYLDYEYSLMPLPV